MQDRESYEIRQLLPIFSKVDISYGHEQSHTLVILIDLYRTPYKLACTKLPRICLHIIWIELWRKQIYLMFLQSLP